MKTFVSRPKMRTVLAVAAPLVLIAVAVPTIASAVSAGNGAVTACVDPISNALIFAEIDPVTDPDCPNLLGVGSNLVTFNQQGPTGPQGPQGAQGAQGPAGSAGAMGSAGPTGATGPAGTNGTNGVAGATGPAGAKGADGVSGFVLREANHDIKARSVAVAKISCPAGKAAIGGGVRGSSKILVHASAPTDGGGTWRVRVTNLNTKTTKITVYASCADV